MKFGSDTQGKMQVIAAPAKKLIGTTKQEPTVQDLGDPTTIISAFGEFVTGNIPVEPEVLTPYKDSFWMELMEYYIINID